MLWSWISLSFSCSKGTEKVLRVASLSIEALRYNNLFRNRISFDVGTAPTFDGLLGLCLCPPTEGDECLSSLWAKNPCWLFWEAVIASIWVLELSLPVRLGNTPFVSWDAVTWVGFTFEIYCYSIAYISFFIVSLMKSTSLSLLSSFSLILVSMAYSLA